MEPVPDTRKVMMRWQVIATLVHVAGLLLACGEAGSAGTSRGGRDASGPSAGGANPVGQPEAGQPGVASSLGTGGGPGGSSAGAGGIMTGGLPSSCVGAPSAYLYCNDFDDDAEGVYEVTTLKADWREPPWDDGVAEGRFSVVSGRDAFQGKSLRARYPEGCVGPKVCGGQWQMALAAAHTELFVAYRLRFAAGFDFVKGGKLPGLVGGSSPTGGSNPQGGFSARGMWRANGAAVQYMYYIDQNSTFGDDFGWDLGGTPRTFSPGTWHAVEHHVVMNAVGESDGKVEAWLDGQKVLERTGVKFRETGDAFAIDAFYFSTFFGGSDSSWAPTKDETVDYDTFVISTMPIGH